VNEALHDMWTILQLLFVVSYAQQCRKLSAGSGPGLGCAMGFAVGQNNVDEYPLVSTRRRYRPPNTDRVFVLVFPFCFETDRSPLANANAIESATDWIESRPDDLLRVPYGFGVGAFNETRDC
jgi:hypothetical protein